MEFARVVFFGRSAEEGVQMDGLEPSRWKGAAVLDCPGGPGSLAAALAHAGVATTAVDPCYGAPAEELERQALADINLTLIQFAANADLDPGFDLEACRQSKIQALETFLADYRLHPERYLRAALPELPFADSSFDLVLSGHLLFSYAPIEAGGLMPQGGFDLAWHRRALAELLRVSRREVRLYPAHTLQGRSLRHPYAEALLAAVSEPWQGSFFPSSYDQGHRGCTDGLRFQRRSST
jgi:SAM-dependent methyltransferase